MKLAETITCIFFFLCYWIVFHIDLTYETNMEGWDKYGGLGQAEKE